MTRFPLTLLALAIGSAGAAHAQNTLTSPDVGRVLRELNPTTPAPAPQAVPLQRIDPSQDADPNSTNEAKVLVKSVAISGNAEIASDELQPLLSGLVGQELSLAQLNSAARQMTRYYRSKGFAVARAYLPAQDITDGRVTFAVIEGRIASQRIRNESLLSDSTAAGYLAHVKNGDVIRTEHIDRSLLLLQDMPGVASSRATLQPGASPGTSELLVEVKPGPRVTGSATLDNFGSRYTGDNRAGANLNIASPLGKGDLLSASAMTSDANLNYARLAYQLPLGNDGLRVGLAYFDMRYRLGQEFSNLQTHGVANSSTLFASYPLVRSQFKNVYATLSYEDKKTTDTVESTSTTTPKNLQSASFGLSGNLQDMLWGGGYSSFEVNLQGGQLDIQSPSALTTDKASARSNGNFSKLSYSLGRLQRITNDTLLSFSMNGQMADKNLDSSEKFSLGGPSGVRAYPSGEGTGDEGYRATLELRHTLWSKVQGVLFYDMGSVTVNKNPFGTGSNSKSLSGVGLGLNATVADKMQLKASLAWRASGDMPTTVPESSVKSAVFWVQASIAF